MYHLNDKTTAVKCISMFIMFLLDIKSMLYVECFQGMDSVTRQTAQHLEFEPEWEGAFNLQLKLEDSLVLFSDWCSSDVSYFWCSGKNLLLHIFFAIIWLLFVKLTVPRIRSWQIYIILLCCIYCFLMEAGCSSSVWQTFLKGSDIIIFNPQHLLHAMCAVC